MTSIERNLSVGHAMQMIWVNKRIFPRYYCGIQNNLPHYLAAQHYNYWQAILISQQWWVGRVWFANTQSL